MPHPDTQWSEGVEDQIFRMNAQMDRMEVDLHRLAGQVHDPVAAGERPGSCMIAVPRWSLEVCPPIQASGVTASEPYASAVHTEWKPSASAWRTRSNGTSSRAAR